jgi:hypothetical protein
MGTRDRQWAARVSIVDTKLCYRGIQRAEPVGPRVRPWPFAKGRARPPKQRQDDPELQQMASGTANSDKSKMWLAQSRWLNSEGVAKVGHVVITNLEAYVLKEKHR